MIGLIACFFAIAFSAMFPLPAQGEKIVLGIAPVFDGSSTGFGTPVSQHLTLFTYQELLNSTAIRPVLLSPGGVYTPLDTSWILDYVQDRKEISLLLLGILKPPIAADSHHWTLPVALTLLDAHSGSTIAEWTVSFQISGSKTELDNGVRKIGGALGLSPATYVVAPSRTFEKQPLGKATAHLASDIRDTLETKLNAIGKTGSQEASSSRPPETSAHGTTCPVHLRITYGYKHAASRSYQLLANGMDQSAALDDGVATFSAPEGELLLQFSVFDSPYKMEKEVLYQLNTNHSCTFSGVVVDLGQSGDAHIHWE